MALVICPECGRDKVSESADVCPDCGFGIKIHYEKIRREEEKKKLEEYKLNPEVRKQNKQYTVQRLTEELESEQKTKKIVVIVLVLCFLIGFTLLMLDEEGVLSILRDIAFLVSAFCVIGLYMSRGSIGKIEQNLNLAKYDYDLWEKELEKQNQLEILKYQQEQLKKPKCPLCSSTNIERISTANRAASIAVVGLASGKIGKQYKCKNCKHMW